jgi:hypothetical protein
MWGKGSSRPCIVRVGLNYDLDRDDLLWREFCRPIEVEAGSKEELAIQITESGIIGCDRRVPLVRAPGFASEVQASFEIANLRAPDP